MLDDPQIVRTEAKQTAVIHLKVPRAEIQYVMGPAMEEVMAALAAQGIEPVGPMFSNHYRLDPDYFDFEVGVPVEKPVSATGRVRAGRLPEGTVVRTVYRGGYEGLGAAWGELMAWIDAHGHETAPTFCESYAVGPESGGDPSTYQTELTRPLVVR